MISNLFLGRHALPITNERVAVQLEEKLVQPHSGLFVVFEHRDIDWPSFYVHRTTLENAGPEPETPPEILEYFAESHWNHFVWIPSRVAGGAIEPFTMQYAHELRHYCQGLDPEHVRSARKFLNQLRRNGWTPLLKFEAHPNEFDAHRSAVRVFQEILGPEALRDYIARESEQEEMARFYKRLMVLFIQWEQSSFADAHAGRGVGS